MMCKTDIDTGKEIPMDSETDKIFEDALNREDKTPYCLLLIAHSGNCFVLAGITSYRVAYDENARPYAYQAIDTEGNVSTFDYNSIAAILPYPTIDKCVQAAHKAREMVAGMIDECCQQVNETKEKEGQDDE